MSRLGKSECWRVCGGGPSLQLDHVPTGQRYSAVPRLHTGYGQTVDSVDSVDIVDIVDISTCLSQMSRQTASQPGWCHLDTQDKWLKIHCLDVKLR